MINDTFNPMNFDLTKSLHGHVRVELRDRWTGRVVNSQEKDNLVTNGVATMIQVVPYLYESGNYNRTGSFFHLFLPLYEKALGGVVLFGGTLTEAASNIYFPSDAKIVGMAGQGSNTSSPIVGSYNAVESAFTSNGFTSVWDFATSQANGTIAAIGRMPAGFVDYLLGTELVNLGQYAPNSMANIRWLGYDETNHFAYFASTSSGTADGVVYNQSQLYRAKIVFDKISMRWVCTPRASQATLIKTLTSADGVTNAYSYNYDKYANNFYCFSGTTLHLLAMDGTHTTKTITGISSAQYNNTENYYWAASSNATTIYRIEKANTSNVRSFTIDHGIGSITEAENDIVYLLPAYVNNTSYMLYPDETMIELPTSSNLAGGHSMWLFPASGGKTRNDFLGTIANLDSPVTKTSSQTMKITYTLTEA